MQKYVEKCATFSSSPAIFSLGLSPCTFFYVAPQVHVPLLLQEMQYPKASVFPHLKPATSTNDSIWEIISYFENNSEAGVGKIFPEQILSRHLLVKLNNDTLFISQCFD